ncbi:MAG: hypothetical protein CMK59_05780 [Proteobacteria bacterium]|nr:hypothetical protein [Pseudomonadota bacterium]
MTMNGVLGHNVFVLKNSNRKLMFVTLLLPQLVGLSCSRFDDKESCIEDEDYFHPNEILQVELNLNTSDWNDLRHQSRSLMGEFLGQDCRDGPFSKNYTYFSADVTINGSELSNIGVRKKGFIGSQSTEKPSLKLNLDEYIEGAELFCTDNITLNNAVQDPSLIRQCLGYDLFAQAGLATPRCNFAQVKVNGEHLGIYAHVEPIKRSFLRDHFGNDHGDLYEGTISDFHELKYKTFESKNTDTDETLAPIIQLMEAIDNSSDLKETLSQHIDVDQFLTFWAMEVITGHWDGFAGNTNNFYLYRDPQSQKFSFIPWGLDDVLDPALIEDNYQGFSASKLTVAVLEDPELSEQFESKLSMLLETVWDEDHIHSEIDRIKTLLSSQMNTSVLEDSIEGIRYYVDNRRAHIEDLMPFISQEIEAPFCLVKTGSIEAEFETSWGTLNEPDLTQEGEVDLDLTWGGYPVLPQASGAGIGPEEFDDNYSVLVLASLLDSSNGSYIFPYVVYPANLGHEGASIDLDGIRTEGAMLYTDASLGYEPVQAGLLYGGTLNFDSYDNTSGGTVSGQLSTGLYYWEEVTE